jgi:hypothetical protein
LSTSAADRKIGACIAARLDHQTAETGRFVDLDDIAHVQTRNGRDAVSVEYDGYAAGRESRPRSTVTSRAESVTAA